MLLLFYSVRYLRGAFLKKLFFVITTLCLLLSGCNKTSAYTVTDMAFNTIISITVYDEAHLQYADEALSMCKEYENIFSRTITNSDLSLLNNQKCVNNVNEELFHIIESSMEYSDISNGALDITIEPLTSLWDITSTNPTVPDAESIHKAKSLVNYKNIVLSADSDSIELTNNASIDLGAIAKGYVADKIKVFLLENGVNSGIINLGGNILCLNQKPDNSNYAIAVKNPTNPDGTPLFAVSVSDKSVVTSGTYERYFTLDNITYHHIIDPATGYPSQSGLTSVTIISDSSFVGDCMSTACLVLGKDDALTLLNSMDGVYGIFIDNENNICYSDGAIDFVK